MTRDPRISESTLPYGRQDIDDQDIAAVVQALRSDWLTTGPAVRAFEEAVAALAGVSNGVAVANGTAALHCAYVAAGLRAGDEVIVPSMTFAATANAALMAGATPVFCDSYASTLLLDPSEVERRITPRTKAVVAVDYAGQPCDYDALRPLASRHGLTLIADACHALGASWRDRPVGSLADLTVFSFHPVKHITTGEGGMIVTDDADAAARMRRFRHHGIDLDHHARSRERRFAYEMVELGYNYRLTDIQCALGLSQLRRLPEFIRKRQELASLYDERLADTLLAPLARDERAGHAFHLYVVRAPSRLIRDKLLNGLNDAGIRATLHYPPTHLHPFYRQELKTAEGLCPVAEAAADSILSLPLFPAMTEGDVDRVVTAIREVLA